MSLTVLLADDQDLVRSGLRMLLDAESDIEVVAEARDGSEAVELATRVRPDVVVMDLRMPGMDGREATEQILQAQADGVDRLTKVLVLTTFDGDEDVYGALRAGASGYLLKHSSPGEVAQAIRRVASGESWLDPRVTGRVIAAVRDLAVRTAAPGRSPEAAALEALTPREREVLTLVAQGLSNGEIRDRLVLSEATVKTHVARILMKTGSRDRASAVALAYRSGFVDSGTPDGPSV